MNSMESLSHWQKKVAGLFELVSSGSCAAFEASLREFIEEMNAASGSDGAVTLEEALLHTCDAEKHTFGHLAAFQGQLATLRWIHAQAPAVLEMEDRAGETPFFCAVNGGHLEVVRWLLAAGACKYHINNANLTPIHCALRLDDDNAILDLLLEGLEPHPNLFKFGAVTGSLLTWCVLTNNIAVFKKLVAVADPHQLAKDCMESPLPCVVVASARLETAGVVLQHMLSKGVAPEAIARSHDQLGCTVLCNLAQLPDPTYLEKLTSGCSEECLRELCHLRVEGATPYLMAATDEAQSLLAKYTDEADRVAQNATAESTPDPEVGNVSDAVMIKCEQLKLDGNQAFSEGKYKQAELIFDEALEHLRIDLTREPVTVGGTDEYKALVSTITSNLSVTCLRNKKVAKAELAAKAAIAFAPDWYKGYYRLAMVKKLQNDFAEATQQMYQCVLRNGTDSALKREFNACLEAAKAQHRQQQATA